MKTILQVIAFILLTSGFSVSQQNFKVLDQNQVSTRMSNSGRLFHDPSVTSSHYEVPKGGANHLIFSGQTIFAGVNQDGDIKVASTLPRDPDCFLPGPFSTSGEYFDYEYTSNNVNTIWKVKKADIIYHIDNFDTPNYTAPLGISDWPGNGNTNVGVSDQLAPYEDLNNNEIYEPQLGEYPCIKGDMAIYSIMNDGQFENFQVGSEKMNLEVHTMMYQFNGNDFIDTTTFLNVKVINRGPDDYTDFKMMFFMDSDIGFNEDEHIGCDTTRNLATT